MGVTPQVLFWDFLFFQMNYNFEGIKIFQWNGSHGRRGRCHSLDRPAALPETGARPIVRFLWKTIFGCFGRTQKKVIVHPQPPDPMFVVGFIGIWSMSTFVSHYQGQTVSFSTEFCSFCVLGYIFKNFRNFLKIKFHEI